MFIWKKFDDICPKLLEDILNLRQEVFVDELKVNYDDDDGKDVISWHGLYYIEGQILAGYVRFYRFNQEVAIAGRLAFKKCYRGDGTARKLINDLVAQVKVVYPECSILRFGAVKRLEAYYTRIGFNVYDSTSYYPYLLFEREIKAF